MESSPWGRFSLAALEQLHPRSLKHAAIHLQQLVRTRLWAQILAGMVLGVGVGVALGPTVGWVARDTASIVGDWLALPGMLFLSLIQMIVIPLIVTAIIRGIAASNDAEQLKKNGIWLAGYFVATTIVATSIGIGLALALEPGSYIDPRSMQAAEVAGVGVSEAAEGAPGVDIGRLPGQVISLFPTNPLLSMVEGQMLQVVLFSIMVGIALLTLKAESAKPILDLLGSVQELSMRIVGWAMRIAPLAVFGLLARQMVSTGVEALWGLAAYVGTFLVGMALLWVVYLLIVQFLGGGRLLRFVAGSRDAQLLAFSTDSSAATMPVTTWEPWSAGSSSPSRPPCWWGSRRPPRSGRCTLSGCWSWWGRSSRGGSTTPSRRSTRSSGTSRSSGTAATGWRRSARRRSSTSSSRTSTPIRSSASTGRWSTSAPRASWTRGPSAPSATCTESATSGRATRSTRVPPPARHPGSRSVGPTAASPTRPRC